MLERENEWLRERFGAAFCDERLEFPAASAGLDLRAAHMLQKARQAAGPRIAGIVDAYLAAAARAPLTPP